MATDALTVESLRKCYGGREVVNEISFNVAVGECFGLLGPNGAGKTTTLRCCLGHIEADAGTIRLSDLPIPTHARAARARVGVVTQFDNLDVHFTVSENLIIYGRYFGLTQRECRALVPTAGTDAARVRRPRGILDDPTAATLLSDSRCPPQSCRETPNTTTTCSRGPPAA